MVPVASAVVEVFGDTQLTNVLCLKIHQGHERTVIETFSAFLEGLGNTRVFLWVPYKEVRCSGLFVSLAWIDLVGT